MSTNLYITATDARSGKSAICLGIMELLMRNIQHVGFFRPIVDGRCEGCLDNDINLIASHFKLDQPHEKMFAYTVAEAETLLSQGRDDELLDGILTRYNDIAGQYDFVLCEGIEFEGSSASFDFDVNVRIANNLGAPVLLVGNAQQKTPAETLRSIQMYLESFQDEGVKVLAAVINRIDPADKAAFFDGFKEMLLPHVPLVYTIPNEPFLGSPTMKEIVAATDATVIYGAGELNRHVYNFAIAAMQLRNFIERIEHGTLVITPGDRADIIIGSLASLASTSVPSISGILLTGGLKPESSITKLIDGFSTRVPILSVQTNTFPTARIVDNVHARITPDNQMKIIRAISLFEKNVDTTRIGEELVKVQPDIITPKMFEYGLIQKARMPRQHIVLPEGEEERILKASEILLRRDVVELTLLGDEQVIREKLVHLGIRLDEARIIEPQKSAYFEEYVETYYNLRKSKGITLDSARDIMSDVSYFGTMMIHKGHADGMVSGAVHTTGHTVRPAFEIVRTKPGVSIVSSVFFMCLEDRVLVYGDCAINPNPNARQLAEIAISSAHTARVFGVQPRVAMLSYSTGESGKGEDVDIVREATARAKEMIAENGLDMLLEGPIQYDAAVDPEVARTKMPDSQVAGRATVFIFPDLNTGNNTYKAVQRSAGAVAIGPVLQGLKKPVNDLSRGCTIVDIVNTVAITAIQAQADKSDKPGECLVLCERMDQ